MSRFPWASLAIFAASAAVTSVFFIQFCATIYQCGCQPLWGDAARYCNIHSQHGKHCPWCQYSTAGNAVFWIMLAAQAVTAFLPTRYGWRWPARFAASLAAFPAVGVVLALTIGWYAGYWN